MYIWNKIINTNNLRTEIKDNMYHVIYYKNLIFQVVAYLIQNQVLVSHNPRPAQPAERMNL
ncbi:hypothetical protein HanRHA438_Chr09g0409431 [Helianthus annuus]|nr:hypothetical protein HanIR_Chr09g0428571 [Helianthus annuus]KAJ0889119.1 hypothetical protein HanRHA438_Chr09g0409431 [Helianthus annuus]